jgi:3-oxoacyl-[acyl-carrier protein] reductase
MKLKGAKVLLTGGSSGIGKETARLLAEAGAAVLITGTDEKKLEKVANEIGCEYVKADVSKQEDVHKTFEKVKGIFGSKLDALINNAGIGEFDSVENSVYESFLRVFGVNVFGPAMMAREAVPIFKKQGHGTIVNVASTSSSKGFGYGSVYASSKFALRGLSQSWQDELREFNIRVMQINPSEVYTAFGNPERIERKAPPDKLSTYEIASTIKNMLEMDDRGFIPEVCVWATNPAS